MAIAFDATATGVTTGTSLTYAHTCASNATLTLFVEGDTGSSKITGATYAGAAMTNNGTVAILLDGTTRYWDRFVLSNPASGANNVVISASSSSLILGVSLSYTGASTTTQPNVTGSNTAASGTTISATVTTTQANTILVGMASNGTTGMSAPSGGTTRYTDNIVNNSIFGDVAAPTAGSNTFSCTDADSVPWGCIVIALQEPTAGPTNVKTFDGVTQSTGIKTYLGTTVANTKTVNGIA